MYYVETIQKLICRPGNEIVFDYSKLELFLKTEHVIRYQILYRERIRTDNFNRHYGDI